MPRYCDAWRTFITSRDSLTVERNSDELHSVTAGSRETRHARTCTSDAIPHCTEKSETHPVSALSHPETAAVKRLTPAVVLRIWVILGNSWVIMGTVLYMCMCGTSRTTTNCIFRVLPALYQRTVIVCRHLCLLFRVLSALGKLRRTAPVHGDILRAAA